MSLVIVWRCRQARREIETKTDRGTERKRTGLIFDLLHSSGRHCGTLHLISQTLIRPDLGSQHYKTALNLRGEKNTINRRAVIACEGGSSYSPHKHFLRELKFGLEGRLIWGKESVPAKSKLVEFNEFCVSAGEPARATLITLCNELRSGEHRRKTKALSSPAASGRQNKRAACTHFKPTWTD